MPHAGQGPDKEAGVSGSFAGDAAIIIAAAIKKARIVECGLFLIERRHRSETLMRADCARLVSSRLAGGTGF